MASPENIDDTDNTDDRSVDNTETNDEIDADMNDTSDSDEFETDDAVADEVADEVEIDDDESETDDTTADKAETDDNDESETDYAAADEAETDDDADDISGGNVGNSPPINGTNYIPSVAVYSSVISGTATVTINQPSAFVAVTDITGVPTFTTTGTPLALTGTVYEQFNDNSGPHSHVQN